MSSLTTAYICEEDAIEDLTDIFRRTLKTEPTKMKILEFMREAAASPTRLNYILLILTGLSDLLKPKYHDKDTAVTLLREALRNLSRDTALIIQVKELQWNPRNRNQVTIDDTTIHVSDIDIETTLKLQTEHLPTGRRQRKQRNRFIIAKI